MARPLALNLLTGVEVQKTFDSISIPANTSAKISLPDVTVECVTAGTWQFSHRAYGMELKNNSGDFRSLHCRMQKI
jgi:hypothetical protein